MSHFGGHGFRKSRVKACLPLLLGASAALAFSGAFAGPRDYLFRDQRICDVNNVLCFRGTLSYASNPRLLHLRARVRSAPGPGLLRIRLAGKNELGHRRIAPLEVRIRGHYSEIIDHQMIPDYPDVEEWEVERVEFIGGETRSD